jgi:membrane protein implicated in regulation of membrane protease activity
MEIIMECILNPGVPCDNLMNYAYIIWFALGIVLIVLEFFIPGVFIVFFGIGALVAGGFHYLFNFGIGIQLTIWIASSFAVLLFGAKFLKDLFPSDQSYEPTMIEHVNGRIVSVIRNVHVGKKGGRISFQGTDWDAISTDSEIPKASFAKIVMRDNLTFHVASATDEEIQAHLNSIKKVEEED